MGLFTFIKDNFWHMLPILVAGFFAVGVIANRYYILFWKYPIRGQDQFFERIRAYIVNDRIKDAVMLCEQHRTKPVARVIKEGLIRAHQPENLIEHGLQVAVGEAQEQIQAKTPYLATVANVATLLGLLGTILGLIQSFEAVGTANAQERSALLAQGISMAMNHTMMGLGVAIPCMIAYSYFMNRTNKLNSGVERSAVKVLDLLKQRFYHVDSQADPLVAHFGAGKKKASS